MPNHLSDIATRHQVYLERLKSGEVKKLQPELVKLEKAIVEVVNGLRVDNLSDLTKTQLGKVLVELRKAQMTVMVDLVAELSTTFEGIAGYEAAFEAKAIEAAAAVKLSVPAAREAYAAAAARPVSATGELLKDFVEDWTTTEMTAVDNLLSKGYADGWTNQQLIRALRGTKKLGYKDGLITRIGRNAEAVVRTAIQHVASTARMETWAKNADIVEKYKIVATLDNVTSQVCRSLDGQVFPLGKGPIPPFHVRCRTTTVAVLDPKFDFLDEGATRSSSEGYVPANLTYYEWLKTQSADFQDSAIGKPLGKLFRDGGLSVAEFAKLNLGRNFEPLTLLQMRKLEPLAFARAGL